VAALRARGGCARTLDVLEAIGGPYADRDVNLAVTSGRVRDCVLPSGEFGLDLASQEALAA